MSLELEQTSQFTEKDVFERLDRLERSVYVPLVSGEVTNWLQSVTKTAEDAAETVCGYYRAAHPEMYAQIAEQDPEQYARVQALEKEDEDICAGLRSVMGLAEKLCRAGENVEPDERLISSAVKELSERVIALVIRIRKHETEISTWHVEAMLRDRGPVD